MFVERLRRAFSEESKSSSDSSLKPTKEKARRSKSSSTSSKRMPTITTNFEHLFDKISPIEHKVLCQSWQHMSRKTETKHMMVRLFEDIDRKAQVFCQFDHSSTTDEGHWHRSIIYDHARHLINTLNTVLADSRHLVDTMDEVLGDIALGTTCNPFIIGQSHKRLRSLYGFKAEFWDIFGESFVKVVAKREIVGTCLAAKAWQKFIAALTDKLMSGYNNKPRNSAVSRSLPLFYQMEATVTEEDNESKVTTPIVHNMVTAPNSPYLPRTKHRMLPDPSRKASADSYVNHNQKMMNSMMQRRKTVSEFENLNEQQQIQLSSTTSKPPRRKLPVITGLKIK